MSPRPAELLRPTTSQLVAGLAVIYVLWGSTYLAIKIAIETLPPFCMAGTWFRRERLRVFAAPTRRLLPGVHRRATGAERLRYVLREPALAEQHHRSPPSGLQLGGSSWGTHPTQ